MDAIKLSGQVSIVLRNKETKEVKKEVSGKNLVVFAGKELVAGLIRGDATAPTHIAVGGSSTAPASGQTALQGTEFARRSFTENSQNQNEVTFKALFDGGWTGTVEEAGIFNAASNGIMLARFLTGTFQKAENDELEIAWQLTVG